MTERTYTLAKGKHITTDVFDSGNIIDSRSWLKIIDDSGKEIATVKSLVYGLKSTFNLESDHFERFEYLSGAKGNISLESISVTLEDGRFSNCIKVNNNFSYH